MPYFVLHDDIQDLLAEVLGTPTGSPVYRVTDHLGSNLYYDAAGNVTGNFFSGEYTWDGEGRMASAEGVSYAYDAEGHRVAKYSGGSMTSAYLYDLGGHVVTEFDGSFNVVRREAYAGGRHLGTYTGSGSLSSSDSGAAALTYAFGDWLGTERARADAAGTLCQTSTSQPFGDNQRTVGTCYPSPAFFTGYERDAESGMDYASARHYASNMGRFVSPDPSGLSFADPANPQSFNLYSYVRNSPLSYVDPSGMTCQTNSSDGKTYDDGDGNGCSKVDEENASDLKNGNYNDTVNANQEFLDQAWGMMGSPGIALSDALSTTLIGKLDNLANDALLRILPKSLNGRPLAYHKPAPNIYLNTTYCGPGGGGSQSGVINGPCAKHDQCFDDAKIDANGNLPGGPEWSLEQTAAAKGCNQALYNAARSHPNAPGASALMGWLVYGDRTPFRGYILKPGTEADPW